MIDQLKELLPARLRRGSAVVPVVRLSGTIGAVIRMSGIPAREGMGAIARSSRS